MHKLIYNQEFLGQLTKAHAKTEFNILYIQKYIIKYYCKLNLKITFPKQFKM